MMGLIVLSSGVCLVAGIWALVEHRQRQAAVQNALRSLGLGDQENVTQASPIPLWMRQAMRAVGPLAERFSGAEESKRLSRLLDQAGHPLGMKVHDLLGLRMLCAVCGLLAGWLFFDTWFAIVGGVGGYLGVVYWLRSIAGAREAQIRVDLPDFLDAVSISLRAGVTIEHALRVVTVHFEGPLHDEFARLLDEIKLGLPRAAALRHMMERTTCKELELLALALIHGLQLGVPLSETFMVQAKALRSSRAQRARQLAGKATPKITMVSTMLVTPAVLGLILGILVLNFMSNPALMGFRDFFH